MTQRNHDVTLPLMKGTLVSLNIRIEKKSYVYTDIQRSAGEVKYIELCDRRENVQLLQMGSSNPYGK